MTIAVVTVEGRIYFWNTPGHEPPYGYDEDHYSPGPDGHLYRNDCTGYLDSLFGLRQNPYSGAIVDSEWTTPITKDDLRFGDILVAVPAGGNAGHGVFFDHWTDGSRTAYHCHEFGWGAVPAHRVTRWPYSDPDGGMDPRTFRPYRVKVLAPPAAVVSGGDSVPVPAKQVATPKAPAVYTVKSGDTLSKVAARYGTTWRALAKINDLRDPDKISVGEKIHLRYVVKSGDTLSKIGDAFNVTWKSIASANHLANPDKIDAGETLLIPSGPTVTATKPPKPFPLTSGYFGLESGPNASHGGAYPWERPYVEEIQRTVGANPDGHFGPDTEKDVKAWQRKHGLVDDGKVGPVTWRAMRL